LGHEDCLPAWRQADMNDQTVWCYALCRRRDSEPGRKAQNNGKQGAPVQNLCLPQI